MWIEITGLDGSGKTIFKNKLHEFIKNINNKRVHSFHVPYNDFVKQSLKISGNGLPLVDNYTDELIFVLDYRLLNYSIKEWKQKYEILISQRGLTDIFTIGELRGFTYAETNRLLRANELEVPTVVIHMNAEPMVAYNRIKNDEDKDKYETLEFMEKQYISTQKIYNEIMNHNKDLILFENAKHIYIDTTNMTIDEVFKDLIEKINLEKWGN